MAFIEHLLKLFGFLLWIGGWGSLSVYITTDKLKLQPLESILCGIWSSIIATATWLVIQSK
jgi:CHASE2 domain-containing sensor protein